MFANRAARAGTGGRRALILDRSVKNPAQY